MNTQDITELPRIKNVKELVPQNPEQLEKRRALSTVQFDNTLDISDAGSLITQAPQMNSVHATINALSAWISAVQPRESWYLAGWIEDSLIEFLVDPGAVVSALSLKCYKNLVAAGSINTPLTELELELEAANGSDMKIYGMCSFELIVHGLSITMDTVVVDLNKTAIYTRLGRRNTIRRWIRNDPVTSFSCSNGMLRRNSRHYKHSTTFRSDTVGETKTNNGRRGPTAGVVLALQTFVQEFGLLVGRSLVRADADDWKVPILLYNSKPCTREMKHCKCNPVTFPARTCIARVEEIQAIQNIGTRTTESSEGEDALPPHLVSVLDTASELMSDQHSRAATLLAKHVNTFPAPAGSPITGQTDALVHEIDTGSTRPIRCNPRKLSPKKIKIQQELVDKMLENGQIEARDSAWSAPTVLVTKKDRNTHFCVDYRHLNARTKKDAFPLPLIDDSLKSPSGQSWFSTLDLASGYWQVKLSENTKPKTAFATHSGLFQFAVMPFGPFWTMQRASHIRTVNQPSDARTTLETLPSLHRRYFGVWQ